jgi:hypothetical protein
MAGVFFWHGFDTCRPDAADKKGKGKGKGKGKYFVGGRGGEGRRGRTEELLSTQMAVRLASPVGSLAERVSVAYWG